MTDAEGAPLVLQLTAANRHDVNTLLPLVVDLPAVAGKPGRPKQKPKQLVADKAFDCQALRDILRWLGIEPVLPARGVDDHGLGVALVRRTHYQLASSVSPITNPLGPQPRSSSSIPHPRRRRHLLSHLDQPKLVLSPGSKYAECAANGEQLLLKSANWDVRLVVDRHVGDENRYSA